MSKLYEQKINKSNTYNQTSRIEKAGELQPNHDHELFLFLTMLRLVEQRKAHYW
jgi:hypothetical protein